jgi:hypothetical protein
LDEIGFDGPEVASSWPPKRPASGLYEMADPLVAES